MQTLRGKWTCLGYCVGHPAASADPAWHEDLAAARLAAAGRNPAAVHSVWLSHKRAAALRTELDDERLRRRLAQPSAEPPPDGVAAGWDLLGFGDGLCLSWTGEPAGRDLAERLQILARPGTFLPDLRAATELAAELEDDVLCAPVVWLPCWRTVHAP